MARIMVILASLAIASVAVVGCPAVPRPSAGPHAGPAITRTRPDFAHRGR